MIIDFLRTYPSPEAFETLEGAECTLCKQPYEKINNYYRTLCCKKCNWRLEFEVDIHNCYKPRIFSCRGFSFCFANNKLYIRQLTDSSYVWGVFKHKGSFTTVRNILEWIRVGECREACAIIRREQVAKAAIASAAATTARRLAEAAVINTVQVAAAI